MIHEYITKRIVTYKKEPIEPIITNNIIDIYDLRDENIDYFINHKNHKFTMKLSNSIIEIEGMWVILNLILLKPMIYRKLDIDKSFIIHNTIVDTQIYNVFTRIYEKVIEYEDMSNILFEIIDCIDNLSNFIICKLFIYPKTIDGFKMGKTMQIPELKRLSNLDLTMDKTYGIKAVESRLQEANKEAISVIGNPKYKDENYIHGFFKLGVFNKFQLPQVVVAVGPRTDLDETMIPLAIERSYLQGLSSAKDYVIDSLSARKSIFYNKTGMSQSQYTNRKQQLLTTSIYKIYPGDCGTTTTVKFYLFEKHKNNLIGINILDNGKVVELNETNIDKYTNKMLNCFLPLTCNHTNGVCHKCGGKIMKYIPDGVKIGPVSSSVSQSPISQMVLSNRHMLSTDMIQFDLPERFHYYFYMDNNNIYLRNEKLRNTLLLGIEYSDSAKLSDLDVVEGSIDNEEYFTQISKISLYDKEKKLLVMDKVPLGLKNNTNVYLSNHMLNIIRKYKSECLTISDNTVWISMEHLGVDDNFISCPSINNSTLEFVRKVEAIQLSKKIMNYHSISDILRDASNLMWDKSDPNLVHIAISLKASLVTSYDDFEIPIVTDPDNVKFSDLKTVIPRRSIGTAIAFENLYGVLNDPVTYLYPRGHSFFDVYLGYNK